MIGVQQVLKSIKPLVILRQRKRRCGVLLVAVILITSLLKFVIKIKTLAYIYFGMRQYNLQLFNFTICVHAAICLCRRLFTTDQIV